MRLSALARRFVAGRCPSKQLPGTISLRGIRRVIKQLWQASVREIAAGKVFEHAATLVQSIGGKVRLDYIVKGTDKAAVWAANVDVCGLYGLALYKGRIDGDLEVIFRP